MSQENLPHWMRELKRYLPIKTLFLLHGNIYDQFLYPDSDGENVQWSYEPLRRLLYRFFKDQRYDLIAFYDQVDGFTSKEVVITATSTTSSGRTFTDQLVGSLTQQAPNGVIGIWTGTFNLQEALSPVADNFLQWNGKGVITAKTQPHVRSTSVPPPLETGRDSVSATLTIAYPNVGEIIEITDPLKTDTTQSQLPDRFSENIQICVTDQSYSSITQDTVELQQLSCTNSGDAIIPRLKLIQTTNTSTKYCRTVYR